MPRTTTFADPKTDFIFKRIFGSEPHKHLLIRLLNALLELEEGELIVDLTYLPAEQKIPVAELKLSIVDVKCVDERGIKYVVEMQLFNVSGFEERVVYNAAKAFTIQLSSGEDYHKLKGVIGVTICDFEMWPAGASSSNSSAGPTADSTIPMLSRWHMQEQHSQAKGLPQVQYVFLELPKYAAGSNPTGLIDKWALFFREAENLAMIPPSLDCEPFREAFEIARMAGMNAEEHDAYELAKMAEQDARGALDWARSEGEVRGEARGEARNLRRNIREFCQALGIDWSEERQSAVEALAGEGLEELWQSLLRDKRWPH